MRPDVRPRPFPWASLDSTTHRDVAVLRSLRRWASHADSLGHVERVLGEIVGARVQAILRRVEDPASMRPVDGIVSVVLSQADAEGTTVPLRIDAERALAAASVARVVRRPPPMIADASGATPWLAGAFAAIVVAAARRCGHVFRVERVDAEAHPARDPWWADENAVAVTLTILVGEEAYVARVGVPRHRVALAPGPAWNASALRVLGATPLSVPLVACTWSATVEEVGALREGDTVVPASWPIARTSQSAWTGSLALSPPGSNAGVRVDVGDGRAVVLRGDLVSLHGAEEATMIETDESALVSAIGDVPVVVRVEVGEATLAAREWAELGRGDVIALSRRLGERVTLRIGGVAVARGELVDIEGELGVRIAERIRDDRGATE